jgi:type IV secretory pathway VirD2 relaxase
MQDVQPVIKQSSIMTPSNNLKGRNQDFRNQMEIERASMQGQSPYTSELFGSYLRNDTSNDDI